MVQKPMRIEVTRGDFIDMIHCGDTHTPIDAGEADPYFRSRGYHPIDELSRSGKKVTVWVRPPVNKEKRT